MKKLLKEKIRSLKYIGYISQIVSRFPFNNSIKVHGDNRLDNRGAWIFKTKIEIIGEGNTIIVDHLARIKNCRIVIHGNKNLIHIKHGSYMEGLGICVDFNGNKVIIGENTIINKESHFSCMEGTSIQIGKDCLLSSGVIFRTGDSHSIIGKDGKRLNISRNIILGDHVWVGAKAGFLKGAQVSEDSVVAMAAVVTKPFKEKGIILAGTPAKVVKTDINWDSSLL